MLPPIKEGKGVSCTRMARLNIDYEKWPCAVLELKTGKGRLSEEQKQMKIMFLHLDHEFYEIRSYREFLSIISDNP